MKNEVYEESNEVSFHFPFTLNIHSKTICTCYSNGPPLFGSLRGIDMLLALIQGQYRFLMLSLHSPILFCFKFPLFSRCPPLTILKRVFCHSDALSHHIDDVTWPFPLPGVACAPVTRV